ncbi:probable serine/threonine-protein kinase At1g54610 [Andrographis paniculata]|uniref:probable serine/threonine-protein kinase At1g54610 n=1 Tax=Andrographis paniculata TaxID=175694 RepID=UPI0021E90724|nr:probable serine/threonine-protein kinase At1g54610 [Andrographis paniculata]
MGCICAKGAKSEGRIGSSKRSERRSKRVSSSRKEGISPQIISFRNSSCKERIEVNSAENGAKEGGGEECSSSTLAPFEEGGERPNLATIEEEDERVDAIDKPAEQGFVRIETPKCGLQGEQPRICTALNVRNGIDEAQVAAGWPTWLSAVAGDAIRGWLPRKLESFEKLDKIGQGTYSNVYRARDLETGKIVALKKVHFQNKSRGSVRFMAREIVILRMLDHPNVMKLEGLITSRFSGSLYLVFEYMEHDLGGLGALHDFTEPQIKCYMQQLFHGLEHCHSRGVLHRDIKCSNLLINDNGNLKIGDFGLASRFRPGEKQLRTTCVVTLWYRPPELLLGVADYGTAVDLWSSGCILAELFKGKPIMPGRTEVEQLHKIFKLCGSPSEDYWKNLKSPRAMIFKPPHPYRRCLAEAFKDFPASPLALLESLLAFEPEQRVSAAAALQSEFFFREPLPCEASTLPKYLPSKEINAKARCEGATQRRKAIAGKASGLESMGNSADESRDVATLDSDAEFKAFMKKWSRQSMCNLDEYNPEDDDSCYTIELPKGYMQNNEPEPSEHDKRRDLDSPSPSDPSEYIELKFGGMSDPQATASGPGLSAFPYSIMDMDGGSPPLHFNRKTSIDLKFTSPEHWSDAAAAAREKQTNGAKVSDPVFEIVGDKK